MGQASTEKGQIREVCGRGSNSSRSALMLFITVFLQCPLYETPGVSFLHWNHLLRGKNASHTASVLLLAIGIDTLDDA